LSDRHGRATIRPGQQGAGGQLLGTSKHGGGADPDPDAAVATSARARAEAKNPVGSALGAYVHAFPAEGLLGAGLFFALSLMPSLIPRTPEIQGALSGVSAAAGFWAALALSWIWRFLEIPPPRGRTARVARLGALGVAGAAVALGLWTAGAWQEDLRSHLGLSPLDRFYIPGVVVVALPVALALREAGRGLRWLVLAAARLLDRVLPRRVAIAGGLLLSATLLSTVASGALGRAMIDAIDASFLALDQLIDPDIPAPDDPHVSGGPRSLITWQDLGRQGRSFVSTGPDAAEIAAFVGAEATDPVRVYVGLGAAATPEARAALALAELQRLGGFERGTLVVATPTGTGWIDEQAIDPLEYLHRGDVATVAMQYSYLTSYVSMFVEPGKSTETAKALLAAVYGHWTTLPREARPRLFLHGLSLGSHGSEQSANPFQMIGDPINGAVWSGPPFNNPLHREFVTRREADSPVWRPRVGDGDYVRFTNQENTLEWQGAEWGPVRLVYLQYASDPITFFSPDLFLFEPAWLSGPRGPDVSPRFAWRPIVTGLQVAFDMVGASSQGTGIGHLYAAAHYIDAWVAVTAPEGWSDADLQRLRGRFPR
jgi:uncharacterized membrane protein